MLRHDEAVGAIAVTRREPGGFGDDEIALLQTFAVHPGFPDIERVREDCDIKHKEQGYLHREEVQWGVMSVGFLGVVAGTWFGGRRVALAARRGIRRIVREELERGGGHPGT